MGNDPGSGGDPDGGISGLDSLASLASAAHLASGCLDNLVNTKLSGASGWVKAPLNSTSSLSHSAFGDEQVDMSAQDVPELSRLPSNSFISFDIHGLQTRQSQNQRDIPNGIDGSVGLAGLPEVNRFRLCPFLAVLS